MPGDAVEFGCGYGTFTMALGHGFLGADGFTGCAPIAVTNATTEINARAYFRTMMSTPWADGDYGLRVRIGTSQNVRAASPFVPRSSLSWLQDALSR